MPPGSSISSPRSREKDMPGARRAISSTGASSATPIAIARQGVREVVGLGEREAKLALAVRRADRRLDRAPLARARSRAKTSPPGPNVIVSRLSARCGSSASASAGTTARPPSRRPGEDLGLGLGDRLERAEQLEVDRADVGDRRDVRLGDLAELGDLPEPAHRHLQHQDLGLGAAPRGCVSGSPISVLKFSGLA